jgi:hypothetical protein
MAREKHVSTPLLGPCHTPGKRAFQDKKAAKLHIRRMRGAEDRGMMQAYTCSSCGRVHVGHKPGSGRKKRLK